MYYYVIFVCNMKICKYVIFANINDYEEQKRLGCCVVIYSLSISKRTRSDMDMCEHIIP